MEEPPSKRQRAELPSDFESEESACQFQDTLPKASLCPPRLRGRPLEVVQKVNDDYLAMLNDHDRNRFFWDAMEALPVKGRRVLDLGAGTGLLSLMAARLGASAVLAVEESDDMAEIVQWSAAHNGLGDLVHVAAGHSTSLSVAEEERADVIVSETFGVLLLQEGCLSSIAHAREHLAKPGAAIVPSGGAQYAMLMASPSLRAVSNTQAPEMAHVGQLRETGRVSFSVPGGFCINSLPDFAPMSDRICVCEVDFHTATSADVPPSRDFRVRVLHDGYVDAVVASWEAWAGKERSLRLTTHAEDTKDKPWGFARDAHWGQGVQVVEDACSAPFAVHAGEELLLTVRFSEDGGTACQFSLSRTASNPKAESPRAPAETPHMAVASPVPCALREEDAWLAESACVPLLCDAPEADAEGKHGRGARAEVSRRYEDDIQPGFLCSERLRGLRSELVQVVNDDYFALLGDHARLRFFTDALEGLPVRGRSVLDLGAGAGQLSVLASKLGAKSVLALEACGEMAGLARESVKRTGVGETVQVEHCLSSRLEIPAAQRADIIICEPYDVFMTGQGGSGSMDYLVDARRRLAKPGALVVPGGGAQFARLVMSSSLSMRSTVAEDAGGLKVSLANLAELLDTASLQQSRKKGFRWSCLPDLVLMSERTCMFSLDFQTAERKHVPRKQTFVIHALEDGFLDAVVTSWEVWSGEQRDHRLSAHAEESRDEPWGFGHDVVFGQGLQLIAEEDPSGGAPKPFAVKKGEAVRLTAHVSEGRELLHFTLQRGAEPPPAGRGRAKRRARGRGGAC